MCTSFVYYYYCLFYFFRAHESCYYYISEDRVWAAVESLEPTSELVP
jgi:hypothetical protein